MDGIGDGILQFKHALDKESIRRRIGTQDSCNSATGERGKTDKRLYSNDKLLLGSMADIY